MTVNILNGIVRIASARHIGTGFVVSDDGLIITCAHVLGTSMPEKVQVMFQSAQEREATVLAEGWRAVDAEDVAFLRVSGTLPEGVQPLPLGSSQGTEGHPMVTFGYPDTGEVEGIRGTGTILGRGAKTRAGHPLLQLRSSEITEGFSGAPIWDEARQRVISMVVIAAQIDALGKLGETAFATPTETLQAIYPTLQVSELCPYRNLEAFTEADTPFFFGRQSIIDDLIYSLQNERRFLAVFGPSGCGKSSLVQAGLIPRLRAGAVSGSDRWVILVTRPTDSSFEHLLTHLNQLSPPTAVILDQFEELFVSFSEAACSQVITQLTNLMDNYPNITLIIVMRNDFYHHFVQQESLAQWMKRSLVNVPLLMKRYELASIVKDPTTLVGIQFEDEGLIETIVNDALETTFKDNKDVGSSTVLPLLEFALTQLWERRQDGVLTRIAYERIGGVTGGLTQWANQAYYSFEERQRPLVRSLFTSLVYLGDKEQRIPDTRRRRELSSLVHTEADRADIDQVAQRLVAARLLVVSQDKESERETVEIIHDALLWEWGLLEQWIEEDRKFLLWRQELERHVRAWVATCPVDMSRRDKDRLLRGSELREAEGWQTRGSKELGQSEHDFISASQNQRISERLRRCLSRREVVVGLALVGLTTVTGVSYWLGRCLLFPFVSVIPYTYGGHASNVYAAAWSPNGKRIASGSYDQTAQVWDATTGCNVLIYRRHSDLVYAIAWSPNGKRIASASFDHTVQVWNAVTEGNVLVYHGHSDGVWAVAWSPDGKRIASGSFDQTAQVWNAATGKTAFIYKGHFAAVKAVAWSPDGKYIASASVDATVQVWDTATGNTKKAYNNTYLGHDREVNAVAWSPDGKRIASASNDKTVQVWDAATGKTAFIYSGHRAAVNAVAWSPDGQRIASASNDKTVQVWDAATGNKKKAYIYRGHSAEVNSVAWSPNGEYIASASADTTVQVWQA